MNVIISKTLPDFFEKLAGLGEMAFNIWWSWHPEARMLFKMPNRQLWKGSIKSNGPIFSAWWMVKEYVQKLYTHSPKDVNGSDEEKHSHKKR